MPLRTISYGGGVQSMRRDEPGLFWQAVKLERTLNDRRELISCATAGVPGVETRRVWHWSLSDDVWSEDPDRDPATLWPPALEGHPDAGWWERHGTCPDCDHREMRLDPDGSVPPHPKDHVFLTRFGRPLDEAISEAQPTLFSSVEGPESCDSGYCWT